MTSRWWAPSSPHIGPDETDFTLLNPVNDPRHDLGAALLALHRVGAAACEEVALQPIPDERTLISSLAVARQAFAAPLVESVSKSVGEGPYAGLLVRDVIDDAEAGALQVFRTAVSKGVPPQVAAQRAGMVYGVPEDQLGAYLAVASELRAHPSALVDAADRALFSAIEKIASEECQEDEQPWEPVSKAPEDTPRTRSRRSLIPQDRPSLIPDDPATDYYDARDTAGRFTRGSLVGPPEVGTEPGKTPVRRERKQRKERKQRREAVQAAPAERVRERTRTRVRDVARRSRVRGQRTREEIEEIAPETHVPEPTRPDVTQGSWLNPIVGPAADEAYGIVDKPVALAMTPAEWSGLQKNMGRDKDTLQKVFRLGYLVAGRDPNYLNSPHEEDPHQDQVKGLARQNIAKVEQTLDAVVETPIHVVVSDDEVASDPGQAQSYSLGKAAKAVWDWMKAHDLDPVEHEDLRRRLTNQMRPERTRDGKGLVFWSPAPNLRNLGLNPDSVSHLPTVNEVVFDPGLLGRDDGTGQNSILRFDPNQIVSVEQGGDPIFDPDIGALRMRFYVAPVYDDNGDVMKADDPSTPYWDHREGGRFAVDTGRKGRLIPTDRPKLIPEDEVEVTPRQRKERKTRRTRKVQPKALQPKRERVRERTRERARTRKISRELHRLRHKQAAAVPEEGPEGYPELRQSGKYRVMSSAEMGLFLKNLKKEGGHEGFIDDPSHKMKLSMDPVPGSDADFQLRDQNFRDITRTQFGSAFNKLELKKGPLKLNPMGSEHDHAGAIFDYAEGLFRENPEVQQISVDYYGSQAEFFGNPEPADPVVLIEQQDDLKFSQPMKLIDLGARPYDEFIPDFDEPFEVKEMRAIRGELTFDEDFDPMDDDFDWDEDETTAVETDSPPMTLNRPVVRHYRLVNVDPTTDQDR